ncbi:DNA-binding response regulator [Pelagivirga sediminicola]|uniref:DNA-binding response regulator n=2 Tax=Pelagivirga sediminicola TaxID=2170575 RepID=A0A2T7G8Y7_9RHOB|nr:DNA-binding response regulator [Pelagivirga sediminicola]
MRTEMDRWLSVLRLLVWGERYVPADLMNGVSESPSRTRPASADTFHDVRLTARQCDVLRAAAAGKQNKIIAEDLGLSQHTVKLHMHHIITKLGVSNRTEATLWYLSNPNVTPGRKS